MDLLIATRDGACLSGNFYPQNPSDLLQHAHSLLLGSLVPSFSMCLLCISRYFDSLCAVLTLMNVLAPSLRGEIHASEKLR